MSKTGMSFMNKNDPQGGKNVTRESCPISPLKLKDEVKGRHLLYKVKPHKREISPNSFLKSGSTNKIPTPSTNIQLTGSVEIISGFEDLYPRHLLIILAALELSTLFTIAEQS